MAQFHLDIIRSQELSRTRVLPVPKLYIRRDKLCPGLALSPLAEETLAFEASRSAYIWLSSMTILVGPWRWCF